MGQGTCKIKTCANIAKARGLCMGHYDNWRRRGDPLAESSRKANVSCSERFWAKVDKHGPVSSHRPDLGPCWLWKGAQTRGYGSCGASLGSTIAHRVAWLLAHGTLPKRPLVLDHLCRVKLCVRPSHLEPVTYRMNAQRGIKGVLTTHCPQGHPYSGENLYVGPDGRRRCRSCHDLRQARRSPK